MGACLSSPYSVVATQKAVRVNFSIFSINATEVASILNGVCIWENRPLSSFVRCVDRRVRKVRQGSESPSLHGIAPFKRPLIDGKRSHAIVLLFMLF